MLSCGWRIVSFRDPLEKAPFRLSLISLGERCSEIDFGIWFLVRPALMMGGFCLWLVCVIHEIFDLIRE